MKFFNNLYTQVTLLFVLSYIGWYFKIPVAIAIVFLAMTIYNVFILKQKKIMPYVFMAFPPLLDVTNLYYHQSDGQVSENLGPYLYLGIIAGIIILIMIHHIIKNIKMIKNKTFFIVLAIYFISIIPSLIITEPRWYIETIGLFAIPIFIMLLVATIEDFKLTDISLVIVLLALQSSLNMLTVFIQGDMIHMIIHKQINIDWSISSNIGSYIVFALPFTIYLIYKLEKYNYITVPIAIWLVVAMFASGSRNAMLAFAVIFIPLIILTIRHIDKEYKTQTIISVIVGTAVLGLIFHFSGILDAIITRLFEKGFDDSGRFRLWETGIEMFKGSPIIGEGMFSLTNHANEFSTHNILIDTLAFNGLIGLAGLFLVSIYLIKQVIKNFDNKYIIIFIGIAAFFVTALVDTSHFNPISLCLLFIPIPYFTQMNKEKITTTK